MKKTTLLIFIINLIALFPLWTQEWTPYHFDPVEGSYRIASDGTIYQASTNLKQWTGTEWVTLIENLTGTISVVENDAQGNIYIGGSFTQIEGQNIKFISKWDGTSWSAMGYNVNKDVRTIGINPSGEVYISGLFSGLGKALNKIAKWDGTEWIGLGDGIVQGGYARTFSFDNNGNVYVGGTITQIGSVTTGFAKWDGTTWSQLGETAIGGGISTITSSIIADNGDIYVGGSFALENAPNTVAHWDGNQWHSLIQLPNNNGDFVHSLSFDDEGKLLVGGDFRYVNNSDLGPVNNMVKWTGSAWEVFEIPLPANFEKQLPGSPVVRKLYQNKGNYYLLGVIINDNLYDNPINFILHRFVDNEWQPVFKTINGEIDAMIRDKQGHTYFGGNFNYIGGIPCEGLAKWDGIEWTCMDIHGTVRALAFDSQDILYVGGGFIGGGEPMVSSNSIIKWDGTNYIAMGLELSDNLVGAASSIAIDKDDKIYIGGSISKEGCPTSVCGSDIVYWTGTNWELLEGGAFGVFFGSVSDLAFDKNNVLHIAGGFDKIGTIDAAGIVKWDGTNFITYGILPDEVHIYDIEFDSENNLYAGGTFSSIGGVTAYGIAKWDETGWNPLNEGINRFGYVIDMVFDNQDNLFIAGNFREAGGASANHVAKWDGENWFSYDEGFDDQLSFLYLDEKDNLIVSGGFSSPFPFVASWEESKLSIYPDKIIIGNIIFEQDSLFTACDSINSQMIIQNATATTSVVYKAGISITLLAGFHAKTSINFTAQIEDNCNNEFVSNSRDNKMIANAQRRNDQLMPQKSKAGTDGLPMVLAPLLEQSQQKMQLTNHQPIGLVIFPNPFSSATTIEFELSEATTLDITIQYMTRQVIQTITNKATFAKGKHEFIFDGMGKLPGMYFLILATKDQVVNRKIVLLGR